MRRIAILTAVILAAVACSFIPEPAPKAPSSPDPVTAEQARSFAAEVQEAIAELKAVDADPKEIERLEQVRDGWLKQALEKK